MELALNLVWACLAVVLLRFWMRYDSQAGTSGQTQFVALALLILILFPVISVTDDLQMAQNPAEADAYYLCTRRDHAVASPHSIFPVAAALPIPVFAGISFGHPRYAAPSNLAAPTVLNPALASIQNRPPPAA
jgi:hypothetical protein